MRFSLRGDGLSQPEIYYTGNDQLRDIHFDQTEENLTYLIAPFQSYTARLLRYSLELRKTEELYPINYEFLSGTVGKN
jgi:hypothetical protein